MEKAEEKWEQEGEEDVEEEGLRGRQSRVHHNHNTTTSNYTDATINNTSTVVMSNGNGDTNNGDTIMNSPDGVDDSSLPHQVVAEDLKISGHASLINRGFDEGIEEAEPEFEGEGGPKCSEKCVYYHDNEGLWKCRKCCWTYQNGSVCSDDIQNPKRQLHMLTNVKTANQQGPCFTRETEGNGFTNGLSQTEHNSIECSAPEKNPGDYRLDVTIQSFDIGKSLIPESNLQYEKNLKHDSLSGSTVLPSEISLEENDTSYNSFRYKSVESEDINIIGESNHKVTELDVERVLEKQDTYDLYCPNCNSCITRRVIIRKRKRKVRTSGEDVKRNKLGTIIGSELDANSASATRDLASNAVDICLDGNEAPASNDYDQERQTDIFRCLSCFSIFIPTGYGFKPIRMFRDKSEKESTQDPQQIPVVKKNWVSSIFASDKGKLLMEQGGAPLEHSKDTPNHLDSLNFSKEMLPSQESDYPEITLAAKTPINIGEPAESAAFTPQQDGLKFPIPSNVSSLTFENSKTDQKVNAEIQKKSSDKAYPSEVYQHNIIRTKADIHTDEPLYSSVQGALLLQEGHVNIGKVLKGAPAKSSSDKDTIIVVEANQVEPAAAQRAQNIRVSAETGDSPHIETQIRMVEQRGAPTGGVQGLDIIKSIVYGGLIESITSLGVVLSAAGADAATLNILALGLANLIGGLLIIGHDLWELKTDHTRWASDQLAQQVDRYQELLGRRTDFLLHAIVAVLSFLSFGLIPPVIYGFSFRKSDDRDLKLVSVAAASLLCIIILASGKAYVKRPPKSYIKTVVYYIVMGLMVSGVSYAVGSLIKKLLEKLGFFQPSLVVTLPLPDAGSMKPAWASY